MRHDTVYSSHSDRELAPKLQVEQENSPTVWGGIVGWAESLIRRAAFGCDSPETYPDGAGPVGTDGRAFSRLRS